MTATTAKLFTVDDLSRDSRFDGYSKRQIDYAIGEYRIDPVARFGIIRAFSENQIPVILSAVRRTARVSW